MLVLHFNQQLLMNNNYWDVNRSPKLETTQRQEVILPALTSNQNK